MRIYSHANYPLLGPDVFERVGGGFVRDVILTSFWQKRTFEPSLNGLNCIFVNLDRSSGHPKPSR